MDHSWTYGPTDSLFALAVHLTALCHLYEPITEHNYGPFTDLPTFYWSVSGPCFVNWPNSTLPLSCCSGSIIAVILLTGSKYYKSFILHDILLFSQLPIDNSIQDFDFRSITITPPPQGSRDFFLHQKEKQTNDELLKTYSLLAHQPQQHSLSVYIR